MLSPRSLRAWLISFSSCVMRFWNATTLSSQIMRGIFSNHLVSMSIGARGGYRGAHRSRLRTLGCRRYEGSRRHGGDSTQGHCGVGGHQAHVGLGKRFQLRATAARSSTAPTRRESPGHMFSLSAQRSRGTGSVRHYGGRNCVKDVQKPRLRDWAEQWCRLGDSSVVVCRGSPLSVSVRCGWKSDETS